MQQLTGKSPGGGNALLKLAGGDSHRGKCPTRARLTGAAEVDSVPAVIPRHYSVTLSNCNSGPIAVARPLTWLDLMPM